MVIPMAVASTMVRTVTCELASARRLPFGPVSAVFDRWGNIRWTIDETKMDPLLGPALAEASTAMQAVLPALRPTRVRVHRDRGLGGDQLLVADVADVVEVCVPYELMKQEVAQQVSLHGTLVLRTILARTPVIGHTAPPPVF